MNRKSIEGTWEEISQHTKELAGHHVRVTLLDAAALPTPTQGARPGHTAGSPVANPVNGMFSDAPELLDEVVEDAMKIREGSFVRSAIADLPGSGWKSKRAAMADPTELHGV
jgi:hypothetical protein